MTKRAHETTVESIGGPWTPAFTAEVTDLLARVRLADGRAPDDPPAGATEVTAHAVRRDGHLAGIAWRDGTDPSELYVDPEYRRRGIGRALASALIGDGSGAGIWAHGTFTAAAGLAAELHLEPVRELLQLRRDLDADSGDPQPVEMPAGTAIRTFVPGRDEAAFLGVNARAFAWHPEQGRLDEAGLAAEMAQDWFDPAGFFLAVTTADNPIGAPADTVLGFHWTKIHRETAPPIGEVYVIGVDPDSPIRRLGAPLTAAGLNHLAAAGLPAVMLYVEADNRPALLLYRRYGFTTAATDTVFA